MTRIIFNCDRCKIEISGLSTPGYTAGYYVVSGDSGWAKYALEGEHFVCDACIQGMPEYRDAYGLS